MINKYLKKGKTYFEVFVKERDASGKQIGRRKRGIPTLKKARDIEIDFINEIRSLNGETSSLKWGDWHEECLDRMKLTLRKSTIMGYDGDLKKWLPKPWVEKPIKDISKNDVYDLIFEHIGNQERSSSNIQNVVLKRIRRIFEMAVEEGYLPRNPALGIKVKVTSARKKVLNSNEANLLLRAAKNCDHRFYYHSAFALLSGMRSGEMYALRWVDVDLEVGLISVEKQWTSKDGLHETKSNRNRVVPIGPDLKNLLLELKNLGPYSERLWRGFNLASKKPVEEIDEMGTPFKDLVLPRLNEWRNGEQAAVLADFCKGIGVTPVKFHDLRATFITNLLAQGVPLVKVMSIVGHSKMSTTDEYLRLAGVEVKEGTTEKLGYSIPEVEKGNVVKLFN